MPPLPGEATLLTVYADIRLVFSKPEVKPAHIRFDKASYVYLFQNSAQGTGRLEIANNPGTPEQDAVAGGGLMPAAELTAALEQASVLYSYKKSTSFTIYPPRGPGGNPAWAIPALDPRGERKYMYPIQALDIYFWSPEEALVFLESLRAMRGIGNFSIEDVPPMKNGDDDEADLMSPIVDRLERAAISIQTKRKGSVSTDVLNSASTYSPHSRTSTPPSLKANGLPPPPALDNKEVRAPAEAAAAFAPAPYNPASPAAPEARVHREKTPPPDDSQQGQAYGYGAVPLASQYAAHANPYAYSPTDQTMVPAPLKTSPAPGQNQSQAPVLAPTPAQVPPPPSASPPASTYHSASATPVPFSPPLQTQAQAQPQASYFQQPGVVQPGAAHSPYQVPHHQAPSHASAHTPQPQYAPAPNAAFSPPPTQPGQPAFSPPPTQPGQPAFSPPPGSTSSQHQPPHFAPPPGQSPYAAPAHSPYAPPPSGVPGAPGVPGYPQATYAYGAPAQPGQPVYQVHGQPSHPGHPGHPGHQPIPGQPQYHPDPNAVHQQYYRPTPEEAAAHNASSGTPFGTGTWGQRAGRAEKSVGKFLKKLDKKL